MSFGKFAVAATAAACMTLSVAAAQAANPKAGDHESRAMAHRHAAMSHHHYRHVARGYAARRYYGPNYGPNPVAAGADLAAGAVNTAGAVAAGALNTAGAIAAAPFGAGPYAAGPGWDGAYYAGSPWGDYDCRPGHRYECRPYAEKDWGYH